MRVEISQQVLGFVRTQPPAPRRALRTALRKLEREQGDIRALEGPLEGYFRLRTGTFRIIFAYAPEGGLIRCLFAERRALVYEVFERVLKEGLLSVK